MLAKFITELRKCMICVKITNERLAITTGYIGHRL